MGLVVLVGPQAVGKMTVGQELAKLIDYQLLFNHMTIDLLTPFLGYSEKMWELSELLRLELFQRFVENEDNPTKGIIFTGLVYYDIPSDIEFLYKIERIFKEAHQEVYFVELEADLEQRLERNQTANRLVHKPSKRDLAFSRKELLNAVSHHRLTSNPNELQVDHYLKINTTQLSAVQTAEKIKRHFFVTDSE